jgi:hypothetical protein
MPGQTFQVLVCGWACNDGGAAISVNYRAQYNAQDVTLIPLVSVALDPPDPIVVQGATQQFTATGNYGDGTSFDLSLWLTWASQDVTIASIDQAGLATSNAVGATTISAVADTISGTTSLTVVSAAALSTIRHLGGPAIGSRHVTRPAPAHAARPPARSHPRGQTSVPRTLPQPTGRHP